MQRVSIHMTKKLLVPAALALLAACGHKAEIADDTAKKDAAAGDTITMEGGVPAASGEETLSVEAAAPSLVAPHGGLLFPAGAAIVELVLTAADQRIYLLDTQGSPAALGDDCQKFSYLAESGEVADFRRTKDGYFVTTDLPDAATGGTSGRIYFAGCPIEGVTSALVQISPDPQRLASRGGRVWVSSGVIVERLREGPVLKLWVAGRASAQGPAPKIRSVSLQTPDGAAIKLTPGKEEGSFTAAVDDAPGAGRLAVSTGKETLTVEVEW